MKEEFRRRRKKNLDKEEEKLKKLITVILVALASLFLVAGYAWGQKEVMTQAQAKLLARRAAQVDAYRNLAETVKGFQLDSKTTVRDFVVENDEIRVELHTSLQGAYVIDTRYLENGLVEVDVAIKAKSLPWGLRRRLRDLGEEIRATGAGAPPLIAEKVDVTQLPPWAEDIFTATGRGAPPADVPESQAKLLALRAAKVDAFRNLAEMVWGLELDARTRVRDFVVDKDRIYTEVHAFIQGAEVKRERTLADGLAEVEVELDLSPFCQIIGYGPYRDLEFGYPFDAQAKLLALRAAKVDALRNLLEIIRGVRIDARTTVRDFLTQHDEIRTQVEGKIRGARVTQERVLPTGIAEVDMELPIRILPRDIRKMLSPIGPVIKATGAGVHPGFWDKVASISAPTRSAKVEEARKWKYEMVRVTGRGAPGEEDNAVQRHLMAERAAKVDAYRNLAEMVYGLYIDSETTVEDFLVGKDIIRTEVQAFIQGARVVGVKEEADGTVEVELELPLEDLPEILGLWR